MDPGRRLKIICFVSLLLNLGLGIVWWKAANKPKPLPATETDPTALDGERFKLNVDNYDFSKTPFKDGSWKIDPPATSKEGGPELKAPEPPPIPEELNPAPK